MRVLPFLLLLGTFAGCSEDAGDFAVAPGLDPRASRIVPIEPGGFFSGRTCYVYLPAGSMAPGKRFPVLYVHDGENAFDGIPGWSESFGFDRAADALTASGEIEPMIIVAIPSDGTRFRDYIPRFETGYPDTCICTVQIPDSTTRGGRYVRAIREDLKPLVDRSFATNPAADHTGNAGFSLGGLISVYAGYEDPETFGIVGGFSGSYYGFSWSFLPWVYEQGRPANGSLFIDTGLIDDNVYDAELLDGLALRQGFTPGVDYAYLPLAQETHTITSVRGRVPAFLRFFSRRVAASRALAAATRR